MSRKQKNAGKKVSLDERELLDLQARAAALSATHVVIEFEPDGLLITANPNFLKIFGFNLEELRNSPNVWQQLGRGQTVAGRYELLARHGRRICLEGRLTPIVGADGQPFKVVFIGTDVSSQVAGQADSARLQGALDKASASVMLADQDYNIIYVNEAAQKLFRDAQNEFRRELPALDAERIVGSNMDQFHRNPAHQREMLAKLRSTYTAQVQLGGRVMKFAVTPVLDATGARLGFVLEWFDRTQEVQSEEEISRIVQTALEGDMRQRVATDGKTGFFSTLAIGLNRLLENTEQMVIRIADAAAAVHRGADEISTGNADLAQRTEKQSSSLEHTASSMDNMTTTVKQNADNATLANQLAVAAREEAQKGGSVVANAVEAMTDINKSSRKISEIISVIDEIAFQTNLLALNAAVEAARAGEQGKGFAVVATEVRSLAGRSATAAKEIKGLIQDSVQKVENGSVLVTRSGQTLDQIVLSVRKVSDVVAEIAAASREQSSGIDRVNQAVSQMDEMTQQNAALVEQATAASQSMADQARELTGMMQQYRVSRAG